MIESRKDYQFYLEQDKKALGIKSGNTLNHIIRKIIRPNLIWQFEKSLRKVEYINNVKLKSSFGRFNPFLLLMFYFALKKYWRLSLKLGFSIPINTFGPGLSIAHYGTIIVNSKARIGANCRIHACVNIGASKGSNKAPQIGSNVYIGPSAVIFGDINIADNVTIGANATVNKDCDKEYVVLAGSPAKVVKEKCDNWLTFNRVVELF